MAPIGVWLLQFVSVDVLWWIYVGVLIFLAFRMAFPPKMDDSKALEISDKTRAKAGFFAGLIGIFAGFLGVGPGFLMMPTLVMVGYTARLAAATNSVIVTLPSFSAFIAHLGDAQFDWLMLILDLDHGGDRRLAGRALHGQAGQVADPEPHLCRICWRCSPCSAPL